MTTFAPMIYPNNFEAKIGFNEVRTLLKGHCLSQLGVEKVDEMEFSSESEKLSEWLMQTREFRRLQEETDEFPLEFFFDVRKAVARLRLEGTHLEENALFDLRRSMETIHKIVLFLNQGDESADAESQLSTIVYHYPTLHLLTENVVTFPDIVRQIDQILDKFGRIKDTASPKLSAIRKELTKTAGNVSRTLYAILRSAQSEGVVDKDVSPTLRDGRLVIPVPLAMKRKLGGIVHDESATGKTVYVEPTAVVETNNRIRELESDERHEIIRILTEISKVIRPHVDEILHSYRLLASIDFIRAKAELAKQIGAIEPQLNGSPHMDWIHATHPLLRMSLAKQGKETIPLDIVLTRENRIVLISGPNAGGKSVCLKTVGLLQYMLQCGLSIPIGENSTTGVFKNIMIDIGDEQSIEDDLSTYSSHLLNMKNMMKQADGQTLLLIDEFGTGTEPQIGGAIAESVLKQFCQKGAFGVITTHYQNLKHFADAHEGVVNGAMLYDRHEMRPLFRLEIGRPGSSFAIEIARKIGIQEEVIRDASAIVGSDYIQSDKYLQDIVRDKRYWENKRQTIHLREKEIEKTIARYEALLDDLNGQRKEILRKAKEQAEGLLSESNKRIENTIREIREHQAEKEETRRIREELKEFEQQVDGIESGVMTDDAFTRKLQQMEERKKRKEKRKAEKEQKKAEEKKRTEERASSHPGEIKAGASVRIKGLSSVGSVEDITNGMATVIFGGMRTKMRVERLEAATAPKQEEVARGRISQVTRTAIDEHKLNFKQDLDVRGMRGDEALNAVMYFIDDAILVGMSRVRILHGKGNGILRQLIRQYLATVPNVTHYADEHVQFGGAGITVVDL